MSRLDTELVNRKIARSRELAKKYIKDGLVFVNGKNICKPSFNISDSNIVEYTGENEKYVGRGGLKLEYAIDKFNINVKDKICLDIGASTGGFTDCLLQNEAKLIYAVDVGSDQLDLNLRKNVRVLNIEKTDIRDFKKLYPNISFDFICTDVSFISLKKITEYTVELLKENGEIVFLIKPQFEVGIENIGKRGVVKDKKVHIKLLYDLINYFNMLGLDIIYLEPSPIKGGSGNTEYLIYMKKKQFGEQFKTFNDVEKIVSEAMTPTEKIK